VTELVGRTTRGLFRGLMTDSTLGEIDSAFQDEGFAPDVECHFEDSSSRRFRAQEYMSAIDWTDSEHVRRFLRVAERLRHGWDGPKLKQFHSSLKRDGYAVDEATGQIRPSLVRLTAGSLAGLSDPSAIREQLDRISRAAEDDPAQAIGSAKELIESTAKVVLGQLDEAIDDRWDLPELARKAQSALGLHPSESSGPDGSEAVKRILGAVSTIANGLAELRNRGYGVGHGPATARVGVRPRHARVAVNAATTWCQLVLDTLADQDAPWRGSPRREGGQRSGKGRRGS